MTGALPPQAPETNVDFRGRPRKRRDFFGTIKRRLNKSKTRSKSAGPGENDVGRDDSLNRSISADRSRNDDGELYVLFYVTSNKIHFVLQINIQSEQNVWRDTNVFINIFILEKRVSLFGLLNGKCLLTVIGNCRNYTPYFLL